MANHIVPHQPSSVPGRTRAVSSGRRHEESLGTDFEYYIEILRTRWWLILAAGVLALGTGWWSQRGKLDQYTAQALLQHSKESEMVAFGLGAATGNDYGSRLEILRSRAVLGRVVDGLGLRIRMTENPDKRTHALSQIRVEDEAPRVGYRLRNQAGRVFLTRRSNEEEIAAADVDGVVEGPGFSFAVNAAEVPEDEDGLAFFVQYRDDAIERLQNKITIEQGRGIDLIWVRYTAPDAQHAADVVNTVSDAYQSHRRETAQQTAGRRREYIKTQIEILADSMAILQAEVVAFQERTRIVDPQGETSARMSALFTAEAELDNLRFSQGVIRERLSRLEGAEDTERAGILSSVMLLPAEFVLGGTALNAEYQNLKAERITLTSGVYAATVENENVRILDTRISLVVDRMQDVAVQAAGLVQDRIDRTNSRIAEFRSQMDVVPGQTAELTRLQQVVASVERPINQLMDQYYAAQIAEGVEAGDVEIVDAAPVPLGANASNENLYMAIALLAGLLVGSLGAIVMDRMDSTIKEAADAERYSGFPVLGNIPLIASGSNRPQTVWLGQEAFRSIRTNLRFAFHDEPRVLAITSSAPGEGKSTIASNLASCYVDQGARVLLIDGDLRRPQIHKIVDVDQEPGLSDVLMERCELPEAVHPSRQNAKLHVLPCGSTVTNPAEILGGERFERLVRYLRTVYDAIIIDTPPVLAVTDAAVVSTLVDGMVLVARANSTDRGALQRAVAELRRVKAPVAGIIMNGVGTDSTGYAYYESYYKDSRPTGDEEEQFLLETSTR